MRDELLCPTNSGGCEAGGAVDLVRVLMKG